MKSVLIVILSLLALGSSPRPKVSIWLIGDSTMAWKKPERAPESGWGEGLKQFVNGNATIRNHAASGRSSLNFINEGLWTDVCDSLQAGDYVIIQFGHNDEKSDTLRHTEPFDSYKDNLGKFIRESKKKGAIPVVCSSIVRRQFNPDGSLKDTHGDYIKATKQAAEETGTLYIDMEALTRELVTKMGPESSKQIYNYTTKKQDSTHLNFNGARAIAELFVDEIKAKQPCLFQYFISE
ncbi:MAG: rhamnogalacturonan acetylesterase [Mangrovibacterium sp.]